MEPNEAKGDDHSITVKIEEVKEESEESDEETEGETKKEEEDDPKYFDTFPTVEELSYHEWLLKNPCPPWVNAKVKTGNLDNIKISCMVVQFLKRQDYIDLESPFNVMSKLNYYRIMSEGLKSRRKPSNPEKISNFVGRVKGLKVFVGNFTYECDFVVLKDTTSIIDHYLGGMILGKPFVKETGLVYDKDEGTVTFKRGKEKITFKIPYKMRRFKHIDKDILKMDNIPPFVITGDDGDQEKTHYSNSLNLGPAYRRDESVTKAIQCLINMKSRENEGGAM
ncbi:protein kinase-like domain, concanavalin A-like lectin/glucanase domain protein [Tanacetum coccineum]